jgi:DUF438 domain-containing protein
MTQQTLTNFTKFYTNFVKFVNIQKQAQFGTMRQTLQYTVKAGYLSFRQIYLLLLHLPVYQRFVHF